ncbi:hypothetical protein ES703_18451 [subsurface metagenome]
MMKRIFIAALLALVCIPALFFGADYTKHYIDKHPVAKRGKPVGFYYGGYAWIFYPKSKGYGTEYMKVTVDFKKETGYIPQMDSCSPGVCCLFKNTLYLFGVNHYNAEIGYTYLMGDSIWWAQRKRIKVDGKYLKNGVTKDGGTRIMAAAELNDTLYLFYMDVEHEGDVRYVYTSDGVNWIDGHGIVGPIVGNVAACNYQTKNGEHRLMIAWMYDGYYVYAANFDGYKISKAWVPRTGKGKLVYATGVTLIPGSAPSYLNTPGHLQVQMYYTGKSHLYPLKRGIYDVNTDTWHVNDKSIDYLYHSGSWPCALSNFKTEGANLRKEVWCFYPWAYATDRDLTLPCVLSYISDLLVVDPDSTTVLKTEDTTYRALWGLLGVLQGPPPYHLNGVEYGNPPTSFTFGTKEEKGTEIAHEYDLSFVARYSFLKKFGGLTDEYQYAMATNYTWDSTFTRSIEYTVFPDTTGRNLGYRFFLKPTITREKIELKDYRGVSTGIHDYLFYVTSGELQTESYEMDDSLRTDSIETFLDRYFDPQDTICSGEVTWLPNIQSDVTFGTQTEYKTTNTSRGSFKRDAGIGYDGFFMIGGDVGGSITFSGTHSSAVNKKLGFEVNGPACGAPRPDHPEDVVSYNLRGYWIQSRNGVEYYWIPENYSGCRPWLFTWNVTNIQYQEGSAEDVEEEELAASLNLDIAGLSSQVTINYSLPQTSPIFLKVYDAGGRLVKVLASDDAVAGKHSITWDGTDDRGRMLASGVYFARLDAGQEQRLAKIVLMR